MKNRRVRAEVSGKGKRRSARLLKLEEQKNDDGPAVCFLDPWQIIRNSIADARGKRKRNDEIQKLQGEASCSQAVDATYTSNLSSKSSTEQIIEYILDMLELRDTHELFAMPDDIQAMHEHVSDYAERVNRPRDFATLRQKNTDGMYKTLEPFENDVYMVFQKAMSINSQDTIPYREAISLLDQAKQVFLSLKSNQMYSEPELMAWRQKHLDVEPSFSKPAGEEDGSNGGGSRDAAATPAQQRPSALAKKKAAAAAEKKHQSAGRGGNVSADNGSARQRGAREGKSTPGKRARKAAVTAEAVGSGGARVERRRLTYTDEAGQGRGTTMATMMPAFQDRHATLLYVQGHTYQDSLRRFVRHAGLKARVAAEFRSLECDARARQQNPAPAYWNGTASSTFLPHGSNYPPSPPSAASPSGGRTVVERAPPECKLETDELLRLFMLMGRPAFLERAKQVFGDDTPSEEISKEGRVTRAGNEARVGVTAAVPAQKSGESEPASAFGPFAPPKLVPGRLGFGQFASSSAGPFKVKPPPSESPGKKKRE